jgi:hypothetical protein
MKVNRLDGVLTRNRKHLVLDLMLAAFFLMALVFSGLAFGTELPKLAQVSPAQSSPAANTDATALASAADQPASLATR